MEENLEVFFCDICNTSVPARDLELGTAARVKDRTIGGCCLPELQKGDGSRGAGGFGTAIGLVLVAGLAGVAVFLDWRLTEETTAMEAVVVDIEQSLEDQRQELLGLEERLDSTALREDIGAVQDTLAAMTAADGALGQRLVAAIDGQQTAVGALQREIQELHVAQDAYQAVITRIERETRDLLEAVAALEAAPRGAVPLGPPSAGGVALNASAGLPPELQHLLGRLVDEDPGTRFEAVDELLRSKNPAVREHLLPMARDPDMFVRRLTVEGLREFRHPECVDTLLVAMADQEAIVRDTAYDSVKELTGQDLPFDADASRDARLAAQRKWQDWWEKNRETF